MVRPVLVVMAAGMGSRYGGLKQIDSVGPCGEVLLDYAVYDAHRAGFEKVIFIIKHSFEDEFKARISSKIEKYMKVEYAFQELEDLPAGFSVPEGRDKPWGTGQPFIVINADDYYGIDCYKDLYSYLEDETNTDYCMMGYLIRNTVSEAGSVTRGICTQDDGGRLLAIDETKGIEVNENGIRYPKDGDYVYLEDDRLVSMNMWGFHEDLLGILEDRFPLFLDSLEGEALMKKEYLLPDVMHDLLIEGNTRVRVLKSKDKWFGITYREDKAPVVEKLKRLTDEGVYPAPLWK